jgi:hypothetical protein
MLKKLDSNLIIRSELWYGFSQLFFLGLHIGHVFKKSIFFARWILEGIGEFFYITAFFPNEKKEKNLWENPTFSKEKKNNFLKKLFYPVFIIKFWRIIFGLRVWMRFARVAGMFNSCGWFICHNHAYMAIVVRYALLLGMGYSVFDWIAGCLTNFKVIFSLFFLL